MRGARSEVAAGRSVRRDELPRHVGPGRLSERRPLRRAGQPAGRGARRGWLPDRVRARRPKLGRHRLRRHELPRDVDELSRGTRGGDVFVARVTPGGTVLDAGGIPVSTGSAERAPPKRRLRRHELPGRLGGRPTAASTITTSTAPASHRPAKCSIRPAFRSRPRATGRQMPELAFDGTNYLVVWQDSPGSFPTIYGARVSPDGTVLDPSRIAISPVTQDWETTPSVAFDGTTFMVVWADGRCPVAARLGQGFPRTASSWIPAGSRSRREAAPARSPSTERTTSCRGSRPVLLRRGRSLCDPRDDRGRRDRPRRPSDRPTGAERAGRPCRGLVGHGLPRRLAGLPRRQLRHLRGTGHRVRPVARRNRNPGRLGGQQQINPTVTFDGSNYLVVWEVRQSDRAGGPLRRAREPHGHGARPRRLPDLGGERHPG